MLPVMMGKSQILVSSTEPW